MRPPRWRLDVLHCDNHVLAVRKPAGQACVPDDSGDTSLFELAKEWVRVEFHKSGEAFLGVVHRLDRPVSGVVVFARTSKAAERLSEQFRERSTSKLYWGVASERPRGREGTLEQWLLKDEAKNRVRAVAPQTRGAQQAATRWRVLEEQGGRTLFEFQPLTGRPHQLRVCAATLGTPLVGDLKYGSRVRTHDQSIGLHARALEFAHPTLPERLLLQARAPEGPVWEFATTRST